MLVLALLRAQPADAQSESASRFWQLPATNGVHIVPLELGRQNGQPVWQPSAPASNLVAVWLVSGSRRQPVPWVFNREATTLHLEWPQAAPGSDVHAVFETAGQTRQFADGRIVFCALDARVEGGKAKLESDPGNQRIGYWTDPADAVSWQFQPTRWGRYDVELAYAAEGGDGTELEFTIGAEHLTATRPSTGSWYRYTTLPIGRVYIAQAEPFGVRVRCTRLRGGAVINLKALILRPAPEGSPIAQKASGEILLSARDGITHSTLLRYEPATNKNCLGYWVDPRDWAEWEFSVAAPGRFEVELWQGCGPGQGGSDAAVESGGTVLPFTVKETGHFQKFLPRRLGTVTFASAGLHTLAVRARRKQAAAIMDVQQIRLLPAAPAP